MVQVVKSIEKKGRKRMVMESTKMTLLVGSPFPQGQEEESVSYNMQAGLGYCNPLLVGDAYFQRLVN